MTSTAGDLRAIGARSEHGTRARYVAGCRCDACRESNNIRYRERVARMREAAAEVEPSGPPIPGTMMRQGREVRILRCPGAGGSPCVVVGGAWLKGGKRLCVGCIERATVWDGQVPVDRARAHMLALRKRGVGYKSVADACDVSASTLGRILAGEGTIRASTERAILAVDEGAAADGAVVCAKRANALIRKMIARGFTRAAIAQLLGYESPALQLGKKRVALARTVARVERLWSRIERGEVHPERAFIDARAERAWLTAVLDAGVPGTWLSDRLGFHVQRGQTSPRMRPENVEAVRRVRGELEAMTRDEQRAAWPRYDERRFDEALGRTGPRARA